MDWVPLIVPSAVAAALGAAGWLIVRRLDRNKVTAFKLVGPEPLPAPRTDAPKPELAPTPTFAPASLGDGFIGRSDELGEVRRRLESANALSVTALSGIGGIGKTQLAAEYAARHRDDYPDGVYWVVADEGSARSSMANQAITLDIEEPHQDTAILKVVHALQQKTKPLLVVFDNVEKWGTVKPWVDALRGVKGHHALVTTRVLRLAETAELDTMRLDLLRPEDALELLLSRAESSERRRPEPGSPEHAKAASITERVGYLPLALRLAVGYLNARTDVSFEDYDAMLEKMGCVAVLDESNPDDYVRGVRATFGTTWERLTEDGNLIDAKQVVVAAAFHAPNSIGSDLLAAASGLSDAPPSPTRFANALHEARQIGMLDVADAGRIVCHRLIQEFVREKVAEEPEAEQEAALSVARAYAPLIHVEDAELVTRLGALRSEVPHMIAVLERVRALGLGGDVGEFVLDVGRLMREIADFARAKEYLTWALELAEAKYGEDHPTVAIGVSNLGGVLRAQGDLLGAKACFERALSIFETLLGQAHPNVATLVNNLGSVLCDLGDLPRAKACFERALPILETALGKDHPTVAMCVNNLGGVLHDLGDLPGAKACFERAIRIDEAAYGKDHPEVARDVNNLGGVLRDLHDLEGAKEHFERALRIDETAYGKDHPEVARDVNNLGGVLLQLGDVAGARQCTERALRICEQFLGPDHPLTRQSRQNLEIVEAQMRR
ncbi:tetratricopeptide repeat protein [Candidatus Poribacteria bacterium]|nr:tetratricopeptide repeat protein [Candidatus Poribacteria bacterium]